MKKREENRGKYNEGRNRRKKRKKVGVYLYT